MQDFGARFADLMAAAGVNPYQLLRELARDGQPGLVRKNTLYDWKNGQHLPDDDRIFLSVVRTCLRLAHQREPRTRRDETGLMRLLAEARLSRDQDAARSKRAGRRSPVRTAKRARDWDPLVLGVRKALGGNPLPEYIGREHDAILDAVLDPGSPANRLVVLMGWPSTGKSRSAFEAVAVRQLASWRLEYPLTPAGLSRKLANGLLPKTVLWLGELRDYVGAEGGPQALEQLGELLGEHGQVAVITTVWPELWDACVADHHGDPGLPSPYAAVRPLLVGLPKLVSPAGLDPARGGMIEVRAGLTSAEAVLAAQSGDPAIREAVDAVAGSAEPGQVIQYLAGVPELLRHYEQSSADPYGRAMITAVMAATRVLGYRRETRQFPAVFVERAAAAYLPDTSRAAPASNWRDSGTEYATRILRGAVRALKPVLSESGDGSVAYQLADFLEQHALQQHKTVTPPYEFWLAATSLPLAMRSTFCCAVEASGQLRAAAQLAKSIVTMGGYDAGILIKIMRTVAPRDDRPSRWVEQQTSPHGIKVSLQELRRAGLDSQTSALVARTLIENVRVLSATAEERKTRAGWVFDEIFTIMADNLASHIDRAGPEDVAGLLRAARTNGTSDQIDRLLALPLSRINVREAWGISELAAELRAAGASTLAVELAGKAAMHVDVSDPRALVRLMTEFRNGGIDVRETALFERDPCLQVDISEPRSTTALLSALRLARADTQVARLLSRDLAAAVDFGWLGYGPDPDALAELIVELRNAGAGDQASALAGRTGAEFDISELIVAVILIRELDKIGEQAAINTILDRVCESNATLDNAWAAGSLLDILARAGRDLQMRALLDRDPSGWVEIDDPAGVACLAEALYDLGEDAQLARLLDRDPVAAADPQHDGFDELVDALCTTGAEDSAERLIHKLPDLGNFELFCEYGDNAEVFKYGREPDGSPASPWGWDDLS